MTTELVLRRAVAFFRQLTSLCLRYGVAKPSVWLCRRVCKLRRFNCFRFDYPLYLGCFSLPFWSFLERLDVHWLFVPLRGTVPGFYKVSLSWFRCARNIAVYSCSDLAPSSLIRKHLRSSPFHDRGQQHVQVTRPFASEHAGQFFSPPRPLRVAACECCLSLPHKSCSNLNTAAPLTGAQLGHPTRPISSPVALPWAPRKHTTVEHRDLKQATGNDAPSVDTARVRSRCRRSVGAIDHKVHKEQKGNDYVSKSRSSKFHPAVYNRRYWLA